MLTIQRVAEIPAKSKKKKIDSRACAAVGGCRLDFLRPSCQGPKLHGPRDCMFNPVLSFYTGRNDGPGHFRDCEDRVNVLFMSVSQVLA